MTSARFSRLNNMKAFGALGVDVFCVFFFCFFAFVPLVDDEEFVAGAASPTAVDEGTEVDNEGENSGAEGEDTGNGAESPVKGVNVFKLNGAKEVAENGDEIVGGSGADCKEERKGKGEGAGREKEERTFVAGVDESPSAFCKVCSCRVLRTFSSFCETPTSTTVCCGGASEIVSSVCFCLLETRPLLLSSPVCFLFLLPLSFETDSIDWVPNVELASFMHEACG